MGVQRPPLTALWVDMELPSGNRWAVANIDANGPYFFQESPFQYECSFFSWGNITPHNPISESQFDYNFGNVNSAAPYYEGQPYGDTPGSTLTGDIPLSMDAARSLLGGLWYMPTVVDFAELLNNSIYIDANGNEIDAAITDKRVVVNGVLGLYLQSKINGARLFLPCSGYGNGLSWNGRGSSGLYWTAIFGNQRAAKSLYFNVSAYNNYDNNRNRGLAVRPIWNPRDLRG